MVDTTNKINFNSEKSTLQARFFSYDPKTKTLTVKDPSPFKLKFEDGELHLLNQKSNQPIGKYTLPKDAEKLVIVGSDKDDDIDIRMTLLPKDYKLKDIVVQAKKGNDKINISGAILGAKLNAEIQSEPSTNTSPKTNGDDFSAFNSDELKTNGDDFSASYLDEFKFNGSLSENAQNFLSVSNTNSANLNVANPKPNNAPKQTGNNTDFILLRDLKSLKANIDIGPNTQLHISGKGIPSDTEIEFSGNEKSIVRSKVLTDFKFRETSSDKRPTILLGADSVDYGITMADAPDNTKILYRPGGNIAFKALPTESKTPKNKEKPWVSFVPDLAPVTYPIQIDIHPESNITPVMIHPSKPIRE